MHKLPSEFLTQFPTGAEISYAVIPQISSLPEPLQSQVKAAFGLSIANIWYTVVGLAGLGLLVTLPMKGLPLHIVTDDAWGVEEKGKTLKDDVEAGSAGSSASAVSVREEGNTRSAAPDRGVDGESSS